MAISVVAIAVAVVAVVVVVHLRNANEGTTAKRKAIMVHITGFGLETIHFAGDNSSNAAYAQCVCLSLSGCVCLCTCVYTCVCVCVSAHSCLVCVRCCVMLNPSEKLSNPIRSCRSIKVFERNIA